MLHLNILPNRLHSLENDLTYFKGADIGASLYVPNNQNSDYADHKSYHSIYLLFRSLLLVFRESQRITVANARPERMMLRVSSYVKPAAMIAGTTREMDSRPRRRSEKPTMS